MTVAAPSSTDRATQGFVASLSSLRARPSLTLIEVAWRWVFGVPALLLMYREGTRVLAGVPWQTSGVQGLSVNQLLTDPMSAATTLGNFFALIEPGLLAVATWMVPALLLCWALISGVGRTVLLRRMDPAVSSRPVTLMLLQLLRVLPLLATAALWWAGLRGLAEYAIFSPIAKGGEPAMMLYVGGAIVLTLTLFVVSAAVGWVFSVAPLLAMMRGTGVVRSLRDAFRVGRVRGALVEINLVLGIVKIALLVLAMVFSACPLPFQSVMTDEFLLWWNVGVAVLYFLASDFFHVARLWSYMQVLRERNATL